MRARKLGCVVDITSAMVKSPHSPMGLSPSCRTALTALCKAISRDVAVDNVTINNLLPERIDTARQKFMAQRMMKAEGITREEAIMHVHGTGRLLVPPVLILLLAAAAGYGSAQEYPTRPIRLIVPSSPGGGTDASARIIQPRLSELLGQPIVVENRPGASGWIGAEAVLRAPPDGHALLMTNATLAVSQSTLKKPPVDPLRDLAPVTQMARVPQMIGGHPSLPPRNVKELIAFMKARPGVVDFSAGNYGGHPHVTMALFMNMTGVSGNFVPYKSGNAGLVDGLSGQVPLLVGNLLVTLPHVRAGRLRAFGVTTAKRAAAAPDIPTIAEAGVPGYESEQWFGVMVPAATPRSVIDRLHRELLKVLQENRTQERFVADGGEVAWSRTPDDFGAMVRAELVKWAKVVKAAGIKPE